MVQTTIIYHQVHPCIGLCVSCVDSDTREGGVEIGRQGGAKVEPDMVGRVEL